jgi:hypothetical protein
VPSTVTPRMLPFPTLTADYRALASDMAALEAFVQNIEVATGRSFDPVTAFDVLIPAIKSGSVSGLLLTLLSNAATIFPPYVPPPVMPSTNP